MSATIPPPSFIGIGEVSPYQAIIRALLHSNGSRAGDADEDRLWRSLDVAIAELMAVVMRNPDPGAAAAYVLASIPKRFDYACELLYGRQKPAIGGAEAERLALLEILSNGRDHS